MRDAGGCTDFVAIITYPDTKTQIPSHYCYTYILMGNVINDEFDNVNSEKENIASTTETISEPKVVVDTKSEPKAGGFKMPIKSDHWLYKYMDDRDGDGMVGELLSKQLRVQRFNILLSVGARLLCLISHDNSSL